MSTTKPATKHSQHQVGADRGHSLDSDSDSDVGPSTTHTDYILGFDDGPIHKKADGDDPTISRIGGSPVLLPFENTKIPEADFNCLICQKSMPMIVQVYCVSSKRPSHDRALYLFGCMDGNCQSQSSSKCVRAFKAWKRNLLYERDSQAQTGHSSLHLDADKDRSQSDENPFKLNTNRSDLGERAFDDLFDTKNDQHPSPSLEYPLASLSLTSQLPSATHTHNSTLCATLPTVCQPPHYLTTAYEAKPSAPPRLQPFAPDLSCSSKKAEHSHPGPRTARNKHPKQPLPEPFEQQSKHEEQEKYEVQTVKGVDPEFLAFQDRLGWKGQSSQLIRYNPAGRPLLLNSAVPRQGALQCGHPAGFELQLMPAALVLLDPAPRWTTAWINSCLEDCGQADEGWIEQQAFAQSAE